MSAEKEEIYQYLKDLYKYYDAFLHGKDRAIRHSLLCMFSKGHLLVEDVPGLGKTTLALAIAKSMGLSFGRIQCTNDLLPSDITGLSIFNRDTNDFEFKKGPIFNNIILVDEINRATPKTQSALLEAMGEKQVTVEGVTFKLPQPFFVIATQNSSEQFGTFPLPESQLDRFMMKTSIGYPPRENEKAILVGGSSRKSINNSESILDEDKFMKILKYIKEIKVSDKIIDYLLDIVEKTRNTDRLTCGLSTRATLSILNIAKSNAYIEGRDYVIPEDIILNAGYAIAHRVIFKDATINSDKTEIVQSIINSIHLPV